MRATPLSLALALLTIAVATMAGALIFEALGYAPCELCLKERLAYYAAIPIAGLTAGLSLYGKNGLVRAAFAVLAMIFLGNALFGLYHAGVEWGFWPGPSACTGRLERAGSADDFLRQLQDFHVVRCDEAALHIFGLSLAFWNALISAGLAALAVSGLRAGSRP
ncbi:MAG: disulfide bond formation protein B, partial [Alphaproteobacteria bacterium]|nr:disulfide bond formation protein B [Alphaproteobacteria bacterium]